MCEKTHPTMREKKGEQQKVAGYWDVVKLEHLPKSMCFFLSVSFLFMS